MEKCDEILELLSLYIDNELDTERAKIVKEHVESCSSCKIELGQLYEIVKMCNEVDEVELPDSFNDVLHQKLKAQQKKTEDDRKITVMRNRIIKTITSVAAIFLVVFAVRGFMNIGMHTKRDSLNVSCLKEKSTKNEIFDISKQENEKELKVDSNARSTDQIRAYGADTGARYGDYDVEVNGVNPQDNDSIYKAFNQDSGTSATKEALEPIEGIAGKSTPADGKVGLEFNEDMAESGTQYSMAKEPKESFTGTVISLTANSSNFESDKLKINEIACRFGTKIEDSYVNSEYGEIMKESPEEAVGYTTSNNAGYIVSYSMDKSNYDKFIKEIEKNYSGKYSVTNNEEQLNSRLKDAEDCIKVLENSKSVNTDEYRSLIKEKEDILKQLESINSNQKIKVHISIYSEF